MHIAVSSFHSIPVVQSGTGSPAVHQTARSHAGTMYVHACVECYYEKDSVSYMCTPMYVCLCVYAVE